MRSGRTLLVLAGALAVASAEAQESPAPLTPEALDFFETKIRPVLSDRCYSCHSAKAQKLKAKLYLDTKEGALKGGESGPAIVPGQPDASLLIKALRYKDEELQMPPKERLPDEVVADFEAWVKMGAPDPRGAGALLKPAPAGKDFWSFRAPKKPAVPTWAAHPVDAFVLAKLAEKGLAPSPPADRRTLLRRASYDLTGLPPAADEIDAFERDDSPDAWEKAIDRLLASPHYGERWGRHWLDVARYADTKEWVVSEERRLPYSYTYRDWVIRAFNEDMPFDRFVTYQIAADRLPDTDKRDLAALGFITVGRTFLNRLPDIIDDRIDVVTRGLLGLSVQCARCHDHKYDPIPTKDYYSLYGVFASTQPLRDAPVLGMPLNVEEYKAYEKELKAREGEITKFRESKHAVLVASFRTPEQIASYLIAGHEARNVPDDELRSFAQKRSLTTAMVRRWRDFLVKTARHPVFGAWHGFAGLPDKEFALKAPEVSASLLDANPLVREAFAEAPSTLREVAERYGQLLAPFNRDAAMPDPHEEELRLALCAPEAATAMAITDVDQFLDNKDRDKMRDLKKKIDETQHHPGSPPRPMAIEDAKSPVSPKVFIRGNPSSLGEEVPRQFLGVLCGDDRQPFKEGSGRLELARAVVAADNPLTARVFVNRVWLHLFGAGIVRTPSDFGTRGDRPTHPELLDWLAVWFRENGGSVKKLQKLLVTSAAYRQSSADRPDARRADPLNLLLWRANRRRLELEAMRDSLLAVTGNLDATMGGRSVPLTTEPFARRRTVYGHVDRLNLANLFRVFDFAGPDMHSPMRYTTTVPQQSLFMMNSPFVMEQAQLVAARPEVAAARGEDKVRKIYRAVFGRLPSEREVARGLAFVDLPQVTRADLPPAWRYGFGNPEKFQPLPHFTGQGWQGGPKLPDPKTGWCLLTAQGGHAGADQAVIRRFTAPHDGTIALTGTLTHKEKAGDGIRARIVSSRHGELASWVACRSEAETRISGFEVERGDTVDFVVECRADNNSDAFAWAPSVRLGDAEFGAASGFGGPPEKLPPPLSAWEKYVHVLLQSNEFVFLD